MDLFRRWASLPSRGAKSPAGGTGDGRHIWRPYMVSGSIFSERRRAAIYRGRRFRTIPQKTNRKPNSGIKRKPPFQASPHGGGGTSPQTGDGEGINRRCVFQVSPLSRLRRQLPPRGALDGRLRTAETGDVLFRRVRVRRTRSALPQVFFFSPARHFSPRQERSFQNFFTQVFRHFPELKPQFIINTAGYQLAFSRTGRTI